MLNRKSLSQKSLSMKSSSMKSTAKLSFFKKNKIKSTTAKLLIGATVLSQSILIPAYISTPVYAASSNVASLASDIVKLSTDFSNTTSTIATLYAPIQTTINGFTDSDWNQVLFNSTSISASQQKTSDSLLPYIKQLLAFNITDTTTATNLINTVSSNMQALNSNITQDSAVQFLQSFETDAKSELAIALLSGATNDSVITALQTALKNAATDPNVLSLFSSAATTAIAGGGAVGGAAVPVAVTPATPNDPTSLQTYSWLQTLTNAKQTLLSSLDPAKLSSELSNIGQATQQIIIPIAQGTTSAELPQNVLGQLRSALPQTASLTFGTGTATFDLPLSLLPKDATDVTLSIQSADASTQSKFVQAVQTASIGLDKAPALIGTPIDFQLDVKTANGQQTLENFGRTFVTRSIDVPTDQNFDPTTSAVVMYDSATGKLLPVPAAFVKDANGVYHALIRRTGNSVYGIISYQKDFSDIQTNWDWAKPAIEQLATRLVINGKDRNTFAPADSVTRAEFTAMLIRALGLADKADAMATDVPEYSDVPTDTWYAKDVAAAKQLGLIHGYQDGTFHPLQTINRAEMTVMIANALKFVNPDETSSTDILQKFSDQSQIGPWAVSSTALAVKDGIINGKTTATFAPELPTSRAETAVMLARLLQHEGFMN